MSDSILLKPDNYNHLPLGTIFHLLSKHYNEVLTERLQHLDIDRYYSVLLVIDLMGGTARQQDLANYLSMDKASVVRVLDLLIDKGYLRKEVHKEDKRAYKLSLTAKGKKNIAVIKSQVATLNKACLGEAGDKSYQSFMNIINKMAVGLLLNNAK